MRYNLLFFTGDLKLADRLQAALAPDCAVMSVDPRRDDSQALAGRFDPHGVIVDTGTHPGAKTVLETIAGLKSQFPDLPLIVVGNELSAQLILASFRAGANDFLDRESPDSELHVAILARLREHAFRQGRNADAARIDVLSPAPADEDYDFALNTAVLIAMKDRSRRVLMLDLSLPASPVRFAMDVEPRLTVSDAIRDLHRLDRSFLDSALAQSAATGLYVLPLADEIVDASALPSLNDVSILLQLLQTMFDVILVYWGPFSRQAAITEAGAGRRHMYLCCSQRFSSVRDAKVLMAGLPKTEELAKKIILVIHQMAPNGVPLAEDIAEAAGASRVLTLQTSWASLVQAHNQGRPLVLQGGSPYADALRAHLADEGLLSTGQEQRGGQLFQWLRKGAAS